MEADEPRLTLHSVADITSEISSHRAIDDVFSASGFRPLSYQGATFLPASLPYLAVVPHLLKGDPADMGRCPTDTRGEGQVLGVTSQKHTAWARCLLRSSPYTLAVVMQHSLSS